MPRVLAALAIVLCPTLAAAQPTVRVRAEARIELRVERAPGAVTIGGTVRDDLGQPLGDRAIQVRVHQASGAQLRSELVRTDARGAFGTSFPLETGSYRVLAGWAGDDGHPRIEIAQTLDLTRAHVRLEVSVGDGRLDLDRPEHEVVVRATSEEGGQGLAIDLRDELDRVLAEGTTDAGGRARFVIESARLGPPAAGRLVAHTSGDGRRAEAQTEVPVVRYRQPALSLDASTTHARAGETIALSGKLQDSAGPLARRAVGLFAGDEHLETVLTDDAGRFSRTFPLDSKDGAPSIVFSATFASDAPWRPPARSEPITVAIDGVGSTPWWWLLGPMLACAIAVGLMSRRRGPGAVVAVATEPPRRPGIAPALPAASPDATVRTVGGVVIDAHSGAPIASARVVLSGGGEPVDAACDADGRFTIDALDGDRWTLEVLAPGYERCSAEIRVPHRGQWSRTTVRLRSLREIALAQYRPVAEALAPERKWWAFWTPRELSTRAASGREELAELTTAVERAAYGSVPPDEADVAAIAERAARIARELEERGSSEGAQQR